MRRRIIIGAGVVYAIGAVITFGHAASEHKAWLDRDCATIEQRRNRLDCYSRPEGSGFGSALAWPLYWSWELQS